MTQQQAIRHHRRDARPIGIESDPSPTKSTTPAAASSRAPSATPTRLLRRSRRESQGLPRTLRPGRFPRPPVFIPAGPCAGPNLRPRHPLQARPERRHRSRVLRRRLRRRPPDRARTKISDITEREGRMGPMLIVSTETTFHNETGKTVAIQRGAAIRY